MVTEFETDAEPRISTLVAGIVADGQELLRQQLALFKCEVREDLRKLKRGAIFLAIGLGMALPAAVLLCVMFVHLLNWLVPAIPLWGCYGTVGGIFAGGAAAFLALGARLMAALTPVDQSLNGLKENVQWLAHPR
jgi:uncharacterized membrane protein